ncbi:hypothetical protein HMPREF0322_01161 [Desulfitobacterium hafniense DP7]|uniref:Uncharacterized protein n=1 Tax=Desulfitobacterium hafniense DP7 TaxID=537010 RepID=G9XJN0_DESHA|nr:hypothetical protein HMPREF0322_01161 [Desulfitobacterium hafniense DP7]
MPPSQSGLYEVQLFQIIINAPFYYILKLQNYTPCPWGLSSFLILCHCCDSLFA